MEASKTFIFLLLASWTDCRMSYVSYHLCRAANSLGLARLEDARLAAKLKHLTDRAHEQGKHIVLLSSWFPSEALIR